MTEASASRARRGLFTAVATVVVAVTCYLPAFRNAFVQDDHVVVEANPVVARGSVREIFRTDYWGEVKGNDRSLYRPVTVLTWALERRVTGTPSPALSHAGNVILHAACSLLLLFLARRVASAATAATAALLFAVHPIHVEAVANVVGRADVLACAFTLAAILIHAQPVSSRSSEGLQAFATAACVFLAVGSKESGIAAPVLLCVYDALFRPPRPGARVPWIVDRTTSMAPTAAAVGAYYWLRTLALDAAFRVQEIPSTDNRLVLLEGSERLATAFGLAARYARLFLAPFGLSADRSGGVVTPEPGFASLRALAGAAILVAAALLVVVPCARALLRGPSARSHSAAPLHAAAFASAVFLVPYLVVGNLLVLIRATVAERLLYLPSAGLCLLVGIGLASVLESASRTDGSRGVPRAGGTFARPRLRQLCSAAFALVLASLAGLTWRQALVWRSEETLFGAALSATPDSPRAAFVLGKIRSQAGRHDEALALFRQARTVWPDFVGAWVDEATELARFGRLAEAEARLASAITLQPDYGGAHHNLGLVLRREGRAGDAERSLRKATIYDPGLHRAWAELGHLRFDAGRWADAVRAYERAVALGRRDLNGRLREARERVSRGP